MRSLFLSRIDSEKLYPPFLAKVQAMLDEALQKRISFWAISGYRSYEEQNALYFQGRTLPKGKIVTNAKGGQSAHNFGVAVDLVRDGFLERAGIQPDYRPESYEPLRELAPKHGLVWGGSWQFKDNPHVQMPGYVSATDLTPLRNAFGSGGLVSVFRFLDNAAKAICL